MSTDKLDKTDTKERILEAAKTLFSQKGYDGTSVREIAEMSQSNVSAINYHFRSKQDLYWAVLFEASKWIESGIANICKQANSPEELAQLLFKFFLQDSDFLRSTMKSMLSESVDVPEIGTDMDEALSTTPGMPGYQHLSAFIRNHMPTGQSDEAVFWVVNTIVSCTVHMALMTTTVKFKLMRKAYHNWRDDFGLEHLKHLARAVLDYAAGHEDGLKADITVFSKS